jgi:UDPglucose 6-dehydrogenase
MDNKHNRGIKRRMKIAVVGTGYVGLVTGTCFANAGNDVVCVDIDKTKVENMQNGQIPIYEPGLENIFKSSIQAKKLSFTTSLSEGVKEAKVIFLALPTPPTEDGSADLSYILNVASSLGSHLSEYCVVVNKSTVPVGTADEVRSQIEKDAKVKFDVVSNPEFLREGHAVEDFQEPDRIVVGTSSTKARAVMEELYAAFVRDKNNLYFMDERSAEVTKYAANTFLVTKISFINEIANLCEILGADIENVRLGIGSDPRIGMKFLNAGIGYGGSCFPKDIAALERIAKDNDSELEIIKAVTQANLKQKRRLSEKLSIHYGGSLSGKVFALWGLAFKPGTDDIREAPSIEIIKDLTAKGAFIVAFDPQAQENTKKRIGSNDKLKFADDMYSALDGADALLITTEWEDFINADLGLVKSLLKTPKIFDGRNIYSLEKMENSGFYYESIGRKFINSVA